MIEKLKYDGDMYLDENGVSWQTRASYLQIELLGLCGCGDPDAVMGYIGENLRRIKEKNAPEEDSLSWDFFLYWTDDKEFTEHGFTIRHPWLTAKGEEVLRDIEALIQNATEEV